MPIADEKKQLDAANEVISRSLSVRKTEELAARMQKPSAAPQAKQSGGLTVDYAAEISKELSALLGRKVQLTDGKKTGKIELEFYGSDDREALIDQLKSLKK